MKTSLEIFSTNLNNLLIAKQKSQSDLARFLKTTPTTVSKWVTGKAMPRPKMVDGICRFLLCTPEDLMTDHSQLLRLLRNPILKGEYRGNTAYCEPLIDSDKWDALQDIIQKNIKHASDKHTYIFTGLIRCPVCGRRMGGFNANGYSYYRCNNYPVHKCDMKRSVSEAKAEKWLLENIEEDYKVQVTMKPKQKQENPQKYKDRLKRLNDMYLLGNITIDEYKAKSAEIQKKIADIQKTPALKTQNFVSNWKDLYYELDQEHRRSFWRSIVKQVVVSVEGQAIGVLY